MASIKVYIPLVDQRNLSNYRPIFKRLGLEPTAFSEEADAVLPLTDFGATKVSGHSKYMPASSLDKILNRDKLYETGLKTLPTTVIENESDAPAGMLVKPRNSVSGGLVYQPHMGFPHEDLNLHFSVNSNSDVLIFAALKHEHLGVKQHARLYPVQISDYSSVVNQLKTACKNLDIRGSIHDIQFVQYQGEWCVIDWNPRPTMTYTDGLTRFYPCLDLALAHMIGLQAPDVDAPILTNRSYWNSPISLDKWSLIESFGLLPRRDYRNKVQGIVRVSGVGKTEQEVNAKFDAMESAL